jgi:hypothetical protein
MGTALRLGVLIVAVLTWGACRPEPKANVQQTLVDGGEAGGK